MRVRGRAVDVGECPPRVAPFAAPGQVFVTPGRDYEVYAFVVFEGLLLFQVVDDLEHPAWRPAWLFDVVDPRLPDDWICNVFHGEPSVVAGPEFVARDVPSYERMVQLEPKEVELFWRRVERLGAP